MSAQRWDPANPLARIPRETIPANAALNDYVAMGSGRSLNNLLTQYRERIVNGSTTPTKNKTSLARWSQIHQWQARIEAWAEIVNQRRRREWEEREIEMREANWADGARLRDLVRSSLDADGPALVKRSRRLLRGGDGQPDREIITLGLDAAGAARLFDLAIKAQAAAVTGPAGSADNPIHIQHNADALAAAMGQIVADTIGAASEAAASWDPAAGADGEAAE